MVFDKVFEDYDFGDIVAYSGKDITDEMLDACFEIDTDFYGKEYYWDISEIKKIVKNYGKICFVFYDKSDKKVMGYSFWFPIKTLVLNAFIKEKRMLLNIRENYCKDYNENKEVNLFLGGEAFVVGYNLIELHKAIEDLFQKRILDMAKAGIRVKYVSAESCCKYDEEFIIPKLGLKKVVIKDKSKFYYGDYSPLKTYADSKYATQLTEYYK